MKFIKLIEITELNQKIKDSRIATLFTAKLTTQIKAPSRSVSAPKLLKEDNLGLSSLWTET